LEVGFLAGSLGLTLEILIYIPTQILLGRFISKQRREIASVTDLRVRSMNEILGAMKLVKLYCWEKSFADRVTSYFIGPLFFHFHCC
jgi:hypothetical protein